MASVHHVCHLTSGGTGLDSQPDSGPARPPANLFAHQSACQSVRQPVSPQISQSVSPPASQPASGLTHPISLKGLQHTSVIELLAFMRLDQSFREGQSALNLFRIFAPNSGMIAEWPAVASRDHEVHEVCLAAEHAESQSLPPENCSTRCRRCKQIFLPTEHSRSFLADCLAV